MIDLRRARVLVAGMPEVWRQSVVAALEERGTAAVVAPYEHDLQRPGALAASLAAARPDVVIHLATDTTGKATGSASRFFHDNALKGIELMEQARRAGVQKYIQVTTVCEPTLRLAPTDSEIGALPDEAWAPYGVAKKMPLVQGRAYRQQYGFNAIQLLGVNLYGPGLGFEGESGVVSSLIRKLIEAKERGEERVVAAGRGDYNSDFLYVDDAARGVVAATEIYDGGEPLALSTCNETDLDDLARRIGALCGYEGALTWDEPAGDVACRALDATQREGVRRLRADEPRRRPEADGALVPARA